MKAITKLLFVALLIGVALNMPMKVRSQSGSYTCQAQFSIAEQNLEQWMNQCAWDCTMDGGSGQYQTFCYTTTYMDCISNPDGTLAPCFESGYQTCDQIPTSGGSCVQNCVNQFDEQFNGLVAQYCQRS